MEPPAPGVLLIAEPSLLDPNFKRTVVLICEHSTEGSFGLVLNRAAGVTLSDVLKEPVDFDAPLYQGGPVQLDTLHYLHPYGDLLDDAIPVCDGVYWGGSFEDVCSLVQRGLADPDAFRFYVGYSGWGPGQLDMECEEGGWIVRPATRAAVFDEDERLWRQELLTLGGEYALLANYPDDPRMN